MSQSWNDVTQSEWQEWRDHANRKMMQEDHYQHRNWAQKPLETMLAEAKQSCASALAQKLEFIRKCFQIVTWVHQQSRHFEPIIDFGLNQTERGIVVKHQIIVSPTNSSVMAHATSPSGRGAEAHCTYEIVSLRTIFKIVRNIDDLRFVEYSR